MFLSKLRNDYRLNIIIIIRRKIERNFIFSIIHII